MANHLPADSYRTTLRFYEEPRVIVKINKQEYLWLQNTGIPHKDARVEKFFKNGSAVPPELSQMLGKTEVMRLCNIKRLAPNLVLGDPQPFQKITAAKLQQQGWSGVYILRSFLESYHGGDPLDLLGDDGIEPTSAEDQEAFNKKFANLKSLG